MKKIKNIMLIFLSLFLVKNVHAYTYAQALQSVTDAFVNKTGIQSGDNGGLIQYDSHMKKYNISPEDAQEDMLEYSVCSSFMYQLYYQTFGISLPFNTGRLSAYTGKITYDSAQKKYNVNNKYGARYVSSSYNASKSYNGIKSAENFSPDKINLSSNKKYKVGDEYLSANQYFFKKFVNQYGVLDRNTNKKSIRVGDIIIYRWTTVDSKGTAATAGHAFIVYSVDENTGKAVVAESYINLDEKIANGGEATNTASHNPIETSSFAKNDMNERMQHFLSKQNTQSNGKRTYITRISVLRLMEGNENQDINEPLNTENSFLNGKTVTASTKSRVSTPGLIILKKSSSHGSVVAPGETITYTITLKNNSNTAYQVPTITETYDLKKVSINADSVLNNKTSAGATRASAKSGTITFEFNGKTLNPKQDISVSYKVNVKGNNEVYLNDKVISTGHVNSIPNATIEDTVGYKFSSNEVQVMKNAINSKYRTASQKKISSYKGLAYLNQIYKDFYQALGMTRSTVLYAGNHATLKLVGTKGTDAQGNEIKYDNILTSSNKFSGNAQKNNRLRDFGDISQTKYYAYRSTVLKNAKPEVDTSSLSWSSAKWHEYTASLDNQKTNYPIESKLLNGDIIWICDWKKAGVYNEYVFLYLDGKIYSNYSDSEEFAYNKIITNRKTGAKITTNNINKVTSDVPQFLAELETFKAYAIFSPAQYLGLNKKAVSLKESVAPMNLPATSGYKVQFLENEAQEPDYVLGTLEEEQDDIDIEAIPDENVEIEIEFDDIDSESEYYLNNNDDFEDDDFSYDDEIYDDDGIELDYDDIYSHEDTSNNNTDDEYQKVNPNTGVFISSTLALAAAIFIIFVIKRQKNKKLFKI